MEKQQAFQQLKQPCIRLLQITASIAHNPGPGAKQELVQALTHLLSTLQHITAKASVLDAKLAEYAFVPISQVLRMSRQVPVRALELCLECISILLSAGWGGGLEPALSGQLIILFTFLAKPSSTQNGIPGTSEELNALALQCLANLFTATSRTLAGKQAMTATANIPALGEAVLVILDSLTDTKSNEVKLQATFALKSLNDTLVDDDALASFLPRMVSSLTKVLTPTSSNHPGFRVVQHSLDVLSSLLSRLLGDENTKTLSNSAHSDQTEDSTIVRRSTSWLQATSSQIKIALANVFKLRDHDKMEVQKALLKLCLCVIQDCRVSLSNCTGMAIETMITLVGHQEVQGAVENDLKILLATDQALGSLLRDSLHGWTISLPRVMQSKDDQNRHRLIHQISVTLRLFDEVSFLLDDSLTESLRDGVSMVLSESKGLEELADSSSINLTNHALSLTSDLSPTFAPLKLRFKGQDDIMADFRLLIQELARSGAALKVAEGLRVSIDVGAAETRLASYWIAVNLIKDVTTTNPSIADFMDLGTVNPREELLDDLYSLSLSVLTTRDTTVDEPWQFYALALETVALQAERYRSEFRAELSEVLYPVLDHLGSSNTALRAHALTCLNIISKASGYTNAGELVVSNVDYIVNAVGLRLAVGDVSPQAPQVLLMMLRLCGPSLLPYLDDLVGSIFDALERYHGYPKLAELLFSVLKGMTEEGVKATEFGQLLIEQDRHRPPRTGGLTMADVIEALSRLFAEKDCRSVDDGEEKHSFPERPWKENADADTTEPADVPAKDQEQSVSQSEEPKPPAPRIFDILLKISELTQHYLTSPSATLRNSLLALLQTTIPALAQHENSFLPLINTLWPVLLPRLLDPEAYIVCNALDIIALMCEHAGEFMRTRIDDAWDMIKKVYRSTKHQTSHRSSSTSTLPEISAIASGMTKLSMNVTTSSLSRPELYVDAPTRMIWSSLVSMLCAVAKYVTLGEERFDEMLDMLEPVIETSEVRKALEQNNADAVWLRLYKKSKQKSNSDAGVSLLRGGIAPTGRLPSGRPQWQFVRV